MNGYPVVPKTTKMQKLRDALHQAGIEYAVFKNHENKMVTINVWIEDKD
tara:strand:- start:3117 stop:3263 length:147 start_codon:yes stop_codon:yes gene_type:complete